MIVRLRGFAATAGQAFGDWRLAAGQFAIQGFKDSRIQGLTGC
jgi:hypothetical protein